MTDAVKAGLLLLFAALVQVSVTSSIHVASGYPDLLLVLVIAVALLRGPTFGAAAGFWAGLVLDIASFQTLGLTSLLLTLAGYFAGRLGEVTKKSSAHPSLVPFQVFEASDGWLVVGCAKEKFWTRLAAVVGHPEWAEHGSPCSDLLGEVHRVPVRVLHPAAHDPTVPPGGGAGVAVGVEQVRHMGGVQVEAAVLPAHRRRVQRRQQRTPRCNARGLVHVVGSSIVTT